jgi:hypothetical protein
VDKSWDNMVEKPLPVRSPDAVAWTGARLRDRREAERDTTIA